MVVSAKPKCSHPRNVTVRPSQALLIVSSGGEKRLAGANEKGDGVADVTVRPSQAMLILSSDGERRLAGASEKGDVEGRLRSNYLSFLDHV